MSCLSALREVPRRRTTTDAPLTTAHRRRSRLRAHVGTTRREQDDRQDIARLADEEGRVVITKDRDFRDGHLLRGSPRRLLIVATGNTSNEDLLTLVLRHLGAVGDALNQAGLVELRSDQLIIHDP